MAEAKNSFIKSKMNKDLDARLLPNGEYREGINIQVSKSEGADVGALENVLGNQELVDLNIVEKRRGLGMFITDGAKKELLKLEKSKFLHNEWPNTLKRAESLGIDLRELLSKK